MQDQPGRQNPVNPTSRNIFRTAAIAACSALGAASFNAQALTTVTTTFQVQITLVASCAISANNLNFGSGVGLLTAAVSGSSTVSVTCSNTTPYNVSLDGGTVSGSTVTSRLMAGTAAGNTGTTLGFQLYSNSGLTTVWGNTIGTNTVSGTGNGTAQTINVYGQVPVQTTPKPDTYQTTITATVSY
jgi:spore coat protein U-like protein